MIDVTALRATRIRIYHTNHVPPGMRFLELPFVYAIPIFLGECIAAVFLNLVGHGHTEL